jgi:hypothetical protein
MRAEDILQVLKSQPFEPFVLHMSDGTSYEVRHPDPALVEKSKVVLGVPGKRGPEEPLDRTVFCSLLHISRIEPVNGHSVSRKRRRK